MHSRSATQKQLAESARLLEQGSSNCESVKDASCEKTQEQTRFQTHHCRPSSISFPLTRCRSFCGHFVTRTLPSKPGSNSAVYLHACGLCYTPISSSCWLDVQNSKR